MQTRYLVAAVCALIVITIYYIVTVNTGNYERYMYGLWTADDDFCDDAGVSSMLLFVGEPRSGWTSTSRSCYLIVADDITSQLFDMTYATSCAGPSISPYSVWARCKFTDGDIFQIGDDPVEFAFDMCAGTLTIRNGERVFARMYKQNDISNVLAVTDDSNELPQSTQ